MTGFEIFWPIVAHVFLVFCLYALLSFRRMGLVRAGKANAGQFRENRDEPGESLVVKNSIANQFELPVLFYVLVILAIVTRQADLLFVAMSWIFVALRVLHAYIMVTTNFVPRRFQIHFVALVVLVLMWIIFAFRILVNV